jgi:transposase-like protein
VFRWINWLRIGGAVMVIKERTGSTDKHSWRCPTRCQKRLTVRVGSVFENSKLPLSTLLHIFLMYAEDVPIYIAHRMLRLHVSENTICEWFDILRGHLSKYLIEHPIRFVGEEVSILQNEDFITVQGVEFDETYVGKKAKNNRGASRQNTIIFGTVARAGTKCSLHIVENVQKATLWSHIEREIDISCPIYSDGLPSYRSLGQIGYAHHVVHHSVEFVTAEGVHTNTIEGLWGLLKQRISRMHGLKSRERIAAHLDEFSYRQSCNVDGSIFNALIEMCRVD